MSAGQPRNCLVRTSPPVLFLINSYCHCCCAWTLDSIAVDVVSHLTLHLCIRGSQSLSQEYSFMGQGYPILYPPAIGGKKHLASLELYLWPSVLVKWPIVLLDILPMGRIFHCPSLSPECSAIAVAVNIWIIPTRGLSLNWVRV